MTAFEILPFQYKYGVLVQFLDHNGLHVNVFPGKYLGNGSGRCFCYEIHGIEMNMLAWETRFKAQQNALKNALNMFWTEKGREARNKANQLKIQQQILKEGQWKQ